MMVVIETPAGVLVRRIENASPLRHDVEHGMAAEQATHDAAAVWGLPDFVYRAGIRRLGASSRELGDRLLLVGDLGVVVQVKSRHVATLDESREQRWIAKHARKGLAQANGTIRQLRRAPAVLTNARGRRVEVNGSELRWLAVVVIDHPGAPDEIVPDVSESPNPAVIILRRDWEFLFEQLKSTHAVAGYFERIAGETLELGHEPVRYFELAAADQRAAPPPPNRALPSNARQFSSPLLPLLPAASEDRMAHLLVRSIFEDIATHGLADVQESQRLHVLAELDRLPVSDRAAIGRFLIEGLANVVEAPADTTDWRLRRILGPFESKRTAHLAFGACSRFSEMHKQAFSSWVQLRHHEAQQLTMDRHALTSVGVLLTPRRDGTRPWDTTMIAVSGDLGLTAEELSAYRALWTTNGSP